MLDSIKRNVLLPMGSRLGTLLAGVLTPYGVHASSAEAVAVGVIGLGLVAVDLIAAHMLKNKTGGVP